MPKTIALFPSVLGVREGITFAAERLGAAGHTVHVIDQFDGRAFDDYGEASEFTQSIGFPALMQRALDGVADLPDGFVAMGFSNGAGFATYVACQRPVERVVLCSGALPLPMIGMENWPANVPAQVHYTEGDPFKNEGSVESVLKSVNEAGAIGQYLQYPGSGHLFTDPSLPNEYDAQAAAAFWEHVLAFLDA